MTDSTDGDVAEDGLEGADFESNQDRVATAVDVDGLIRLLKGIHGHHVALAKQQTGETDVREAVVTTGRAEAFQAVIEALMRYRETGELPDSRYDRDEYRAISDAHIAADEAVRRRRADDGEDGEDGSAPGDGTGPKVGFQ